MRLQKKKVKRAIAILEQVGIELPAELKHKALAGCPVIDERDHKRFEELCCEAWVSGEPFVINFNYKSDHPLFHTYSVFRRLRRHILHIRAMRGKKKKIVIRIKRHKKPVETK